ncbi:MAG: heme ABC transporter ATP-binding protein [Limnochordia bacterium]|jgi:iron complex transport system ATP-binding protein
MLDIKGITFRYVQEKQVLQGIDLTVEAGDFLGIIGPNGCGKTTLLKIIAKALRPQGGIIRLMDRPLAQLSQREIAQRLGVVPQRWQTGFAYTVKEVVGMGRFAHKKLLRPTSTRDRQVIDRAMELTQVAHLARRPITQLSGGELQRVLIAQALAQNPQVLLLDEATSNLDINHQMEIMELIKELNDSDGLTVIAVMHDLNMAAQYCQRLVLLQQGQIFAQGTPEEVLTPDNIRQVYGTNVRIRKDPLSGRPFIMAYPQRRAAHGSRSRVHVIGGGGRGTPILEGLIALDYETSCGVINQYDADWDYCQEGGIPMVTERAFAPISQEACGENIAMIREAQLVILAHIPFGHGNLVNLRCALKALKEGIPLLVCDFSPIEERDFTKGEAQELYAELFRHGAQPMANTEALFDYLQESHLPWLNIPPKEGETHG